MIRFLCSDMIQKANSGHPGAALGMAELICAIQSKMNYDPKEPNWLNKDRLIFSGGHASALLYAFLHLSGYDLSLEDLKNFRQLHSKTPGHPELFTPGVEIATGPLGQGVANAVGYAMAAKRAAVLLGEELINHHVFCLCGDGDLQEGISYEACSLAGVHALDKLILIYDSNDISIEGDTALAFNEDVKKRFEAQNFFVQQVNGHDIEAIKLAIDSAKKQDKPSLIIAKTLIAKGALEQEGKASTHGSPLGEELIARMKEAAGFDPKVSFFTDEKLYFDTKGGENAHKEWKELLDKSDKKELLKALKEPDLSSIKWPNLSGCAMATRDSNSSLINAISQALPGFLGGSADLGPSNKSVLKDQASFPQGGNIHFGIREHAMAAITNAFARYGLFLPYCATFFIFSEYLKPAFRMAALMKLKNFFIFTHDSIGVGEDGPTHQPIEQLSAFRAQPGSLTFRPADGVENTAAWQVALNSQCPTAFVLSRQKLECVGEAVYGSVANGAYLLKECKDADVTLLASGSEVSLALKAAASLESEGRKVNVVSLPCYELFLKQDVAYKAHLLKGRVVGIEAANSNELYRFCDLVIGIDSFGESGKDKDVFAHFGFTPEMILAKIKELL